MGRHNIQFKGLRHSPSDITGQDGDLLECVNLIHDNGELKPVEMPERMSINGKLKNGLAVLVAVHNVTNGKKFVFALYDNGNTTISYKEENSNSEMTINTISGEQIQWAETIGNTLIIGTDKSTHYALYKNVAYKWLGDKVPRPVFDFKIGWTQYSEKYHNVYEPNPPCKDIVGDYISGGGIPLDFQHATGNNSNLYVELENTERENKEAIRDNFKAKMAELINSAKKNNRFVFPFFVRYALRLYDNTYVMHSSPLLMLPSTYKCPILSLINVMYDSTVDTSSLIQGNNDHHFAVANLIARVYSQGLSYRNLGFYDSENRQMNASDVSEWEDIIKGVDVFLSSEIQTYNPEYYDELDNLPTKYHHNPISTDYGNIYIDDIAKGWWSDYFGAGNEFETEIIEMGSGSGQHGGDIYKNYIFPVPQYSKEHVIEKLKNVSLFYKVKQYGLKNMLNVWSHYRFLHDEVEYGTLERLEALPTLPDDYVSRCRISGNANYNYNQRLLLGNIRLESPLWYKFTEWQNDGWNIEMCFVIEKKDKTINIRADNNSGHVPYYRFGHYIFYPDPDCKRCIIHAYSSNYDAGKFVVEMQEHTGLNGAFAIMPNLECFLDSIYEVDQDGNPIIEQYTGNMPNQSSDRWYHLMNTIAMSGVANPFHFPSSNFKDIGRAEVIGIAANTLDVSSGQWGQYPLYVFCSDGIIAVMIDGEGKFGGIQAVSADVLLEPIGLSRPTLVQTGQMLMFLTRRGVMAIAGTKIQCVSEAMEGRHFNTIRELPDAGQNVGSFVSFIRESSDDTDFRDYAASAFLAYDYAHNRVLVIRPDRDYQYVYALKTGMWSKEIIYTNLANLQVSDMHLNDDKGFGGVVKPLQVKPIGAAVNNYTEMYLQDRDSWLYRTMGVAGENNTKQLYQYGYFVSRPIRFGTDEYKTITRLLHRYTHYAVGSNVKLALYGSRDGVRYGRINTLRGMSYQYFIFVIFTYLKPNERYSYVSVDFETRLTNKLR